MLNRNKLQCLLVKQIIFFLNGEFQQYAFCIHSDLTTESPNKKSLTQANPKPMEVTQNTDSNANKAAVDGLAEGGNNEMKTFTLFQHDKIVSSFFFFSFFDY